MNKRVRTALSGLAIAATWLVAAAPLAAADFYLQAQETTRTVATAAGGIETVTMWEYASCPDASFTACVAAAPGPLLRVPAGESLNVHLKNNLVRDVGGTRTAIHLSHVDAYGTGTDNIAVPTSIQIAGLAPPSFALGAECGSGTPAPVAGATGRLRSFTAEVPNGEIGSYCWAAPRAGSYVYQSGTHPAVQVQMGLYGGVVVEAAASGACTPRCAYAGVGGADFNKEIVAIYSELDPALHASVADDSYGDGAAGARTSTIFYEPQYFFVDGQAEGIAFSSRDTRMAGQTGDRVLLRLLNAGIESHSVTLPEGEFTLIGEDGSALDASLHGHAQHSTLLAAGKGLEAIWTLGAEGNYHLLDRRRQLANSSPAIAATGTTPAGAASGMLLNLLVGPAPPVPLTLPDNYAATEDTVLTIPAAPPPPDGVLANDPCTQDVTPLQPCTTVALVAGAGPAHGLLELHADGGFVYTPAANYNGPDAFQYRASNGLANSAPTLVTIDVGAVNDLPVANDDGAYEVLVGTTTLLPPLVANDTDVDGDALVVAATGAGDTGLAGASWTPSGGTAAYTAPAGYEGPDSFQYYANDGTANSAAPATVTLLVTANLSPQALDDTATMAEDSGSVTIDVLANDSDPANDPINVSGFTASANGTVAADTTDPAHTRLVFTPNANFNGVATFTYTITDVPSQGAPKSATATVRVTVTPVNDPPVARNDSFTIADDATTTVAAPGVLANDSDVDGDALVAVLVSQPANATVVLNANGGFSIATVGVTGTVTFTYQARDPSGALSNIATVTVNLNNGAFQIANGGVVFNTALNRFSANGASTMPAGRLLGFYLMAPGQTAGGTLIATARIGVGAAPRTWSFNVANSTGATPEAGSRVRIQAIGLPAATSVPLVIQ
ncbi:MAG: tandem-95 repeat protein [Proteobacteria bacterium]|nr:tandem-95 repeat protein [Pseudomonadota bacterium]